LTHRILKQGHPEKAERPAAMSANLEQFKKRNKICLVSGNETGIAAIKIVHQGLCPGKTQWAYLFYCKHSF
jgi:hypothetical protein